jgi:AraC family transcriptional regulator
MSAPQPFGEFDHTLRRSTANAVKTPQNKPASCSGSSDAEAREFGADILLKRVGKWASGKAILLDRRPHAEPTEFKHRLNRHAIVLHLEGGNTRTVLRYDRGPAIVGGNTLGQVMFIPSAHELEGTSNYPKIVRHLVVLLDPAMFEADMHHRVNGHRLDLPFRVDLKDGVVAGRMRELQAELESPGLLSALFVESLSCEIAIRLARLSLAATKGDYRGGLSPRRLRLVKDYIEENLARDIRLRDIAKIAGVSTAYFCRAFHKSTGIPSHQYIVLRRIDLAKRLLTDDRLPIAEVALAAGFGNQSHLTKHFHRLVGTTPRRFRNQV